MKTYCIAIDGPAGAGKTTTAKAVAQSLSQVMPFYYVDTGSFYRALTLYLITIRPDVYVPSTGHIHKDLLNHIMAYDPLTLRAEWSSNNRQQMFINNRLAFDGDLRTEFISQAASRFSTLPEIRELITDTIRRETSLYNTVMEGRDTGTSIRKDADCKIFLTADADVRARRRCLQLLDMATPEKPIIVDTGVVQKDIQTRDERDTNREHSPLRIDESAIVIDNTHRTINQTVDTVLFAAAYRGIPVLPCLQDK